MKTLKNEINKFSFFKLRNERLNLKPFLTGVRHILQVLSEDFLLDFCQICEMIATE